MSHIVSIPDTKMNDFTIVLNTKSGVDITLDLVCNVKYADMETVVSIWSIKTKTLTSEDLVNYINSKSKFGYKARLKK